MREGLTPVILAFVSAIMFTFSIFTFLREDYDFALSSVFVGGLSLYYVFNKESAVLTGGKE